MSSFFLQIPREEKKREVPKADRRERGRKKEKQAQEKGSRTARKFMRGKEVYVLGAEKEKEEEEEEEERSIYFEVSQSVRRRRRGRESSLSLYEMSV